MPFHCSRYVHTIYCLCTDLIQIHTDMQWRNHGSPRFAPGTKIASIPNGNLAEILLIFISPPASQNHPPAPTTQSDRVSAPVFGAPGAASHRKPTLAV